MKVWLFIESLVSGIVSFLVIVGLVVMWDFWGLKMKGWMGSVELVELGFSCIFFLESVVIGSFNCFVRDWI